MKLSELIERVDDVVISKKDIDSYKIYLEKKDISKWKNVMSIDDPNLDMIYNISRWFESNISLEYFKNLILDELEKKDKNLNKYSFNNCSTFFSVIIKTSEIDSDLVNKIYGLYSISFEWKYWFYLIDTDFDIDNANSFLIKNMNLFKNRFIKNFWIKEGIIIPYYYRSHYYYILHYNELRNNSFMEWFFLSNMKINTKKSCIFFFWENEKTWQKFLVIKQTWKLSLNNAIISTFIKYFDKVIDYHKYPIWNLNGMEIWNWIIKGPTSWNININNVELYWIWYDSVISFSWEHILKDISNFTNRWNKINLISADLQFESINETAKKNIGNYISWRVSRNWIEYITPNQNLWYFLSLLESSDLIQTKAVWQFNTKDKIILECLFKGECFIKSELDEIWEIKDYIWEIFYISDWKIEKLKKEDIDFKNMSFNEFSQYTWSIAWSLKITLNFEDLFKKIVDECANFTTFKDNKFSTVNFLRTRNEDLKNTVIIFAEKFEDIMTFMKQGKKYLLFLENSNINEELVKYLVSNKIIFKLFWKKSLSELFAKWKIFIEENVANCKYIENNDINVIEISESWNGDDFEDIISYILTNFIYNHISLWNRERWISLPDWIIFEWDKNIFYDAKSSKNIVSYLWSDELRKFKSYIELFPTWKSDNIFICFWPKIDTKWLSMIEERVEMKEILKGVQKIIYIWADCLDLLYQVTKQDWFKEIKWFIKPDWLTSIFSECASVWKFWQLDINYIKNKFKYAFKDVKPEILEKIEDRSKWKVDLMWTIENIKQYVNNLSF